MSNVGLGITFVQRVREINQFAVQFGCIVVVAQPHNPKLCNNLDDFAFSSPSALWLNRTNYSGFCGSMQRKPRFMQVNSQNPKNTEIPREPVRSPPPCYCCCPAAARRNKNPKRTRRAEIALTAVAAPLHTDTHRLFGLLRVANASTPPWRRFALARCSQYLIKRPGHPQ